ncbi:DUF2075 domain-containing protein [Demequina salsinemoris]|uniref:DUF2075 domain-containing protein n=1 Tax=Demequina salsinemoris TaxID=577470 RepID=UPI0007863FDB|nr:DUF2075 domain-containing protein [Demequina salsinemoris]
MKIERLPFSPASLRTWEEPHGRQSNWPVVYTLNDRREVYVGETLNAVGRMRQHLDNPEKKHLTSLRVVIDEQFNKSVCLDLESYLIRLFAGDGQFTVLNRNDGITNADYFDRDRYQALFGEIFEQLREDDLFRNSIAEIENSDLFKLSPFKALTQDQEVAIVDILEGLFDDLSGGTASRAVIQGAPGTGKTIVAIYLMKLLSDIASTEPSDDAPSDSVFSDFFVGGYREALRGFRMGLVVPQQSLRRSIKGVFRRVPGLRASMVLSAYDVYNQPEDFDLLIVDETHRLSQWGAQSAPGVTNRFRHISQSLAHKGERWESLTQLDWISRRSRHQLLLLDHEQSVRPIDLPPETTRQLRSAAGAVGRLYPLRSQMRVQGGDDYLAFVRELLSGAAPREPQRFAGYDLRFFESLRDMRSAIIARDHEAGLSRLVAGFGWKWLSKKDPAAVDINIDGLQLQWNQTDVDWINTPTSLHEVGSIHTVQGYDLNYAGVIIGPELKWDPSARRIILDRAQYADTRGKQNNRLLGITYSDDEILSLVLNAYRVLLTRGMRGTYVYVCDPALRHRLRAYFD